MIDENKLIEDFRKIHISFNGIPMEESDMLISYRSLARVINKQPKIEEWIPCSERLPSEVGEYLVTGDDKCWICKFVKFGSIGGWTNDIKNPVVKAWMPLPESYKE